MSELIHSNSELILWLIPGAPLIAAAVIAFFGKLFLGERSHVPCVAALGVSFLCSLALLNNIVPATFEASAGPETTFEANGTQYKQTNPENAVSPQKGAIARGYQWIDIGTMQLRLDLRADAISAIMLAMVINCNC